MIDSLQLYKSSVMIINHHKSSILYAMLTIPYGPMFHHQNKKLFHHQSSSITSLIIINHQPLIHQPPSMFHGSVPWLIFVDCHDPIGSDENIKILLNPMVNPMVHPGKYHENTITGWWCNNHLEKCESR